MNHRSFRVASESCVDFLGTQEPVRTVPALLGGLPGSGLLLAEMDVAGDGEVLALELSGRADVS